MMNIAEKKPSTRLFPLEKMRVELVMDQQEFVVETASDEEPLVLALPSEPQPHPAPRPPDPQTSLLLDNEELFRQLAESIHEVFWICAAHNCRFLYISPAYEKIWGRSCQSLYEDPSSIFDTVVPEDRARLATALAEQSLLPQTEIEYRIVRPDNSLRWIRTRTFPVQTQGEEVYRVVGVSQDITDRKAAEKAILEISARERRRIGQDLHDSLLQQLTGIAYMNKALQQKLAGSTEVDDAVYIGELLQEAIGETRALARGLNPVQLDAHGLMSALRELAVHMEKLFKIPCVFACEDSIRIHDFDAATQLYRIAQEALSNAMKHAAPKQVVLSLDEIHGILTLQVRDDGKGFPEAVPHDAGMGLHIMNNRARMIGATLTVQRGPEKGTCVTCSYPHNS